MTSDDISGQAALRGGFAARRPVGVNEAAELLGARVGTVRMWRARGIFPPPRWVLSGTPVWEAATIEAWARETGRWGGDAPRHALPAKHGRRSALEAEAEPAQEPHDPPQAVETRPEPVAPVPAPPVRAGACPPGCPVRMYGPGARHSH